MHGSQDGSPEGMIVLRIFMAAGQTLVFGLWANEITCPRTNPTMCAAGWLRLFLDLLLDPVLDILEELLRNSLTRNNLVYFLLLGARRA